MDASPSSADTNYILVNRSWWSRFSSQFTALTYKTTLVYGRNFRSTILRILSPLFFMLLLYLVNIAIRTDNPYLDAFVKTTDPQVSQVDPIPACSESSFVKYPCYDFVYSPANNTNPKIDAIVNAIKKNNPGRVIDDDAVLSFPNITATNTWMAEHPEQTMGGLHFIPDLADSPSGIGFVLQSNSTVKYFRNRFEDPNFYYQVPLQVAAEREIARYQWIESGKPAEDFFWEVSTSQFAHPTTSNINIVGQAMGPFVFAANLFNFVMMLAAVVTEKEGGLRRALRTTGMLDSAFWASWFAVELCIALLFTLMLIAFGAMFQFNFFLVNNFFLVFFLFFLFQVAMVTFGFFCCVFLSKSQSAVNLGFILFIIGWIFQTVVAAGYPYSPNNISSVPIMTFVFSIFPWSMLAKGSIDLGDASANDNDPGISWSNKGGTGQHGGYCQDIDDIVQQNIFLAQQGQEAAQNNYYDFDCVWPLPRLYIILFFQMVLYFVLAVYLDNILADEDGVKRKPWYFLTPSYWSGSSGKVKKQKKGSQLVQTSRGLRSIKPPIQLEGPSADADADLDVAAEESRLKSILEARQEVVTGTKDSNNKSSSGNMEENGTVTTADIKEADATNAVELFGLQRVFRAPRFCGIPTSAFKCFSKKKDGSGNGDFWAIKGSWYSIEKGSLFALLGPNGAGKTTTINVLTGVLPASGGDALIYGESLSAPGGIDRARVLMGVCPQFDVLWGELTGEEHLYIYGRVKGLSKADLKLQSTELLEKTRLTTAAAGRTSAYSGDMRRRLSVALSLLGDPLLVFLDEPTTGMDPISRRHVWDIIEESKRGRAIVLTTHSMEEADILADRIGIMARGKVRALGTSMRLKQRFGSGYQLAVAVGSSNSSNKNNNSNGNIEGEDSGGHVEAVTKVKALFKERLGVVPSEQSGGYLQFLIPKESEAQLPGILKELDDRKKELLIEDVQISLTSLEEVFLSIAKKAELEAAVAEGRKSVKVEVGDEGKMLEVGVGEEFAVSPDGVHYGIEWTQDEQGGLIVSKCTPLEGGGGGVEETR